MVDVPSPKVVTYRVVKVCCEGDIQCEQAQADLKARREEAAEEQLLAIVLGSCAAVIIIVAIIVGLSLRRRKKRCMMTCEERKHVYISTEEEEETSELQTHTRYTPHGERTADSKECESQYAEIHESGLPRYADIFREEGSADPFLQATAPPISMYEARAEGFLNNGRRAKHESDSGQVSSVVGDTKNQQETQLVCGHCPHSTVTHSTAHCDRCHEHRSKDSCDQAVPSVTKDDPAVLTGAPTSSPPSPPCVPPHPPSPPCVPPPPSSAPCVRTLPPHPASASHTEGPGSCDDRCKPERPPPFSTCRDRGGAVRYETLTAPGCKDSHEYQRLSTPAAEDVQM
ncbi:uncharacterized protein LOC143300254 [Babylonia areolata]|uniref:uncharacterized protein LOC143300254 n=1 Tax=Babylonia areolata TaxID=304850 RepID=UPI003FD29E71